MNTKLLLLLSLFSCSLFAQNTPVFLIDTTSKNNVLGLNITYENTIYGTINYDQIIDTRHNRISVGIEFGSPLLLIPGRNKILGLNTSLFLFKGPYNVQGQCNLRTSFYEDVLSKGLFMDLGIGLFPGYYKSKYFSACELSYKNNILTTFNFSKINPIQDDLTLFNTTGAFRFGLSGGVLIKKRFETKARLFYSVPRDFSFYPPYTQGIGFALGTNFWF
jgi:hypothetical protein